jgi:hypothetical protein
MKQIFKFLINLLKIPFILLQIIVAIIYGIIKSIFLVIYSICLSLLSFVGAIFVTAYIYNKYSINIFLMIPIYFIARQIIATLVFTINNTMVSALRKL